MQTFLEFLKDVFDSWAEKVGIALTLIALVERIPRIRSWLEGKPLIDRFVPLLWVIASFLVFWGFYAAWGGQYNAATLSNQKLNELTVPHLVLSIDELGVGDVQLGTGPRQAGVFVIANLINKGAPSIAENWVLRVILTDGRSSDSPAIYLNPEKKMTGRENVVGGDWAMSMADALYTKASKPIQRGDKVRGLLVFIAPAFKSSEMRQPGTKYILQCADVEGKKAEFVQIFSGKAEEHHYFPGLSPIPH